MIVLSEWAARERLAAHGIHGPECVVAKSEDDAAAAAARIGFPVVLKVHAGGVLHKSDVGGVRVDLRSEDEVRRAFLALAGEVARRAPGVAVEGALVQPFIAGGVDVFLGAARDPAFGPYLLLGLGGVLVEVLDDVVAIAWPAAAGDVLAAAATLRGARVLRGVRGRPGADLGAVAALALALGRFMDVAPDVVEVDLNPVCALPPGGGALPLDARIVLGAVAPAPAPRARPSPAALTALLDPRAVVVIGASRDPAKFGSRLVRSLRRHGFERPLWALHPRAREVQGIPAFPALDALPGRADLALVTIEGDRVPDIVRDCGAAGVQAAVVCASGFAEAGGEGEARQRRLVAAAAEAGVAIVGPNTAGVIGDGAALYGSFLGTMEMQPVRGGNVALLTQSGSIGSFLLGRGWERGLGFRAWVATGDEAGMHVEDLVAHVAGDPGTRVIALFLEMVRDGRVFRDAVRGARARGKRLVAYAIGRSASGREAVRSHTGSLAGNHRLYDAVFRQDGVSRVADLEEFLDTIQALSWCPLPAGRRVMVVSTSGASCGIAADDCEANGLALPAPPPATAARLARILPAFATVRNPLDLTAEAITRPALAAEALDALAGSGAFDALLIALGTQQGRTAMEVADAVVGVARRTGIPIVLSRLGADSLGPELLVRYREARLPLYPTPTRAARVLRHLVFQARPEAGA
jgi:acyl-CoA synthetase (NDP forming)